MATPLPLAKPAALMTTGSSRTRRNSSAAAASVKLRASAVGIACWRINSLANHLSASICAAALLGPKTPIPAASKRSANPAASGSSGPITARSICFSRANFSMRGKSMPEMATFSPSCAVPGFPGRLYSAATRGEAASFQAKACSRAPLPMRRTFMTGVVYGGGGRWTSGGFPRRETASGYQGFVIPGRGAAGEYPRALSSACGFAPDIRLTPPPFPGRRAISSRHGSPTFFPAT